jgi:TrmH family RNA methyltransferase
MEWITSRSNPKIKQVRALRSQKNRRESSLYIIEGIRPVGEAVESGASIFAIYYAPEKLDSGYAHTIIDQMIAQNVPCYPTTAEVFQTIAEKDNPQGILALARQPLGQLSDLNPTNFSWGVALVEPQDPGNVGAILRTIDAVGASGLLLLSAGSPVTGIVDPYHPNAVRASMGTIFWHPVIQASFPDFTRWAKEYAYAIYGTSAHGALDYHEHSLYQKPCILLLGSEREGLSAGQAAVCDRMIRLPMHGRATSLNLAVAAGVLLYDMLGKLK